eukprot:gnl/Hemi2/11801_TR4050_c0_g1_i1.p1 gnl/Hemi2/11801_TR4050_c0_g1~~gnl/Hemi2/11801_TR4050_c0_g1_i1.p1  ORF type:complete len:856 (-),score=168.63 gnl/Hemi2/11801_TR4050_c0_g1_i1:10-2577(-)
MFKAIECSVCLENYRADGPKTPALLDCAHTFCTDCLTSLLSPTRSVTCPTCRTVCVVGEVLKKNFALLEILSAMAEAPAQQPRPTPPPPPSSKPHPPPPPPAALPQSPAVAFNASQGPAAKGAVVWKGRVSAPNFAHFAMDAVWEGGAPLPPAFKLPYSLDVKSKICMKQLDGYLNSIDQNSRTRSLSLLVLRYRGSSPASDFSVVSSFCDYHRRSNVAASMNLGDQDRLYLLPPPNAFPQEASATNYPAYPQFQYQPLNAVSTRKEYQSSVLFAVVLTNVNSVAMVTDEEAKKPTVDLDPYCGLAGKAHVLEQGADVFSCMLTLVGKSTKFLVIQAIESDACDEYWCYTRWGREGMPGQNRRFPFGPNKATAVSWFVRKFLEKTRNRWENRASFHAVPGKYTLTLNSEAKTQTQQNNEAGAAWASLTATNVVEDDQDFLEDEWDSAELASAAPTPLIPCPACTVLNDATAATCFVCEAALADDTSPEQPEAGAPPTASPGIPCPACTVLNDATAATCYVCEAALADDAPPEQPEVPCPSCTFFNSAASDTCVVCESPLPPSAQKPVFVIEEHSPPRPKKRRTLTHRELNNLATAPLPASPPSPLRPPRTRSSTGSLKATTPTPTPPAPPPSLVTFTTSTLPTLPPIPTIPTLPLPTAAATAPYQPPPAPLTWTFTPATDSGSPDSEYQPSDEGEDGGNDWPMCCFMQPETPQPAATVLTLEQQIRNSVTQSLQQHFASLQTPPANPVPVNPVIHPQPVAAKTPKRKPNKKRGKKDPFKPKRARSAYMFFCQNNRDQIQRSNPTATFATLGGLCGAAWSLLSSDEKTKYIKMAESDKARNVAEMKAYVAGSLNPT